LKVIQLILRKKQNSLVSIRNFTKLINLF